MSGEAIARLRDHCRNRIADDVVTAALAQAWDEALQGMAWALDNGPDDAALAYVRDHNPYRTTAAQPHAPEDEPMPESEEVGAK